MLALESLTLPSFALHSFAFSVGGQPLLISGASEDVGGSRALPLKN